MKHVWIYLPGLCVALAMVPLVPVTASSADAAMPRESVDAPQVIENDSPLARRLEKIDAIMAKVLDLQADFEQRRRTPLLKKPLVSKGIVWTKGDLVRWETLSPRESWLMLGRGSIRIYYPADKLVEIYPIGEGFKDLAGAPLPRLSVLKARFEIAAIASSQLGVSDTSEQLLALQLTPKSEEMRKHVALVRVLIDESQAVATKVVMVDPDGETTEINFTNIRINRGVSDAQVDPPLPENVRVSRPLGDAKADPGKPLDRPPVPVASPSGADAER